jgi:hypothetical protein
MAMVVVIVVEALRVWTRELRGPSREVVGEVAGG